MGRGKKRRRSGDDGWGATIAYKVSRKPAQPTLHLQNVQNLFTFHRKLKAERTQVSNSMSSAQGLLLGTPSSCTIAPAPHAGL